MKLFTNHETEDVNEISYPLFSVWIIPKEDFIFHISLTKYEIGIGIGWILFGFAFRKKYTHLLGFGNNFNSYSK